MTLTQFKQLDQEERYMAWLSNSIEVASYESLGFMYLLYQIDNFYIELRILKLAPEDVVFAAFQDEYRLKPYLEKVDITEIYELL